MDISSISSRLIGIYMNAKTMYRRGTMHLHIRLPKTILVKLLTLFMLLVLTSNQVVFAAGDSISTSVEDTQTHVETVKALAQNLRSQNSNIGRRTGKFTWDTEGKSRSWTYYNGIMMDAYMMLDCNTYLDYVDSFYAANISSSGRVDNSSASDNYYRTDELDSIPPLAPCLI